MNCIDCDKEFKPFVHNQTRCRTCVAGTNYPKKESKVRFNEDCEWCGSAFEMQGPASRYCSKSCNLNKKRADNYGLSYTSFNDLIAKDKCEICGSSEFVMDRSKYDSGLVIDHCHTTGKVRGMLCHNCNRALGLLQDDKDYLEKAISYLERATTISKESTPK